MEKDRKFRALAIAAICVAVVGVSVAYAALGAALNVTGTATVSTKDSWNVVATNATCTATGQAYFVTGEEHVTSKVFNVDGTSLTWDATFTAPKDAVTCTFTWTNGGSIDAAVTKLVADKSGTQAANFTYDIKIGNNAITTETIADKYLKAKTSKDVTIVVTFDKEGKLETLPTTEETATFTAAFEFAQADSSKSYTEL